MAVEALSNVDDDAADERGGERDNKLSTLRMKPEGFLVFDEDDEVC